MTFDDGILTVCRAGNKAGKGDKPVIVLSEKAKYYYSYDNLGINRYYTALQNRQQIEAVVNISDWNDISATDICVLENQKQYRIVMIQPTYDNGLKITKLSLERLGEEYAFQD